VQIIGASDIKVRSAHRYPCIKITVIHCPDMHHLFFANSAHFVHNYDETFFETYLNDILCGAEALKI
jgi:hypothetical protein